jgi:TolB-like protein/Tfp pilus assembly protein PilF
VAVLPLLNLTGDATLNDFADGLTDEVITQLGTAAGDRLAVISRTSAMAYRDSRKSVADIARELDVSYVLEGALRREGDALRINNRLIAVSTQAAIAQFEEMLDRTSTALPTHEVHASIRIARNVASELLPAPLTHAEARPARTSAAAWDTFLQANAAMNRGTSPDIRRAVAGFEDTVTRDPQFAAAWARLAEAQHLLAMMGVAPPGDAYPAAQHAAQQAMRAAPDQANAHLANGLVQLWYNWRPADAAAAFERALALNPSLAAAHHDYAWALVALGRQDEAIRHITRARDLDPLSTRANNDVGWLYLHLRQPQDATRACQQTLALDAGSLEAQACLERSYAQRQLFTAAFHAARATLPTPDVQKLFGDDSGTKGLRAIWTWRLQQLQQAAATRWINPYTLAVLYALTDDPTRALDALDDAYAKRVGMMVLLARDPAMDPLRGHPRFVALLQKVSAPPS